MPENQMLTLDDYTQNPALMETEKMLTKELAELIRRAYPDSAKSMHYKALLGHDACNRMRIATGLSYKLQVFLNEIEEKEESYTHDELGKMVDEIFGVIIENFGKNEAKLREYISILSDGDARDFFSSDLKLYL